MTRSRPQGPTSLPPEDVFYVVLSETTVRRHRLPTHAAALREAFYIAKKTRRPAYVAEVKNAAPATTDEGEAP